MRASLSLQGEDLEEAIATNFQHWLGRHSERKRNRLGKNAYELVYELIAWQVCPAPFLFSEILLPSCPQENGYFVIPVYELQRICLDLLVFWP